MPKLPACDRIRYYRFQAQEMRAEAAALESPGRRSYLRIAEQWEQLAADVERRLPN